MKTIKRLYRRNYTGEDVITNMSYEEGTWNFEREKVKNSVVNNQISDKAVVIGNGVSRKTLDLNLIKNHKGGLLAAGALQSYGCNALYRDFNPHFLVANGDSILNELVATGYADQNIVYANANAILDYPGKFYLIPQDPSWNAGAVAAYLAAFDGHQTIYLVGFDGIDHPDDGYNVYAGTHSYPAPSYGYSEDFWVLAMLEVFNTYNTVDFVRVMPSANWYMPEAWKFLPNLRQIDYRTFVNEVDL